MKIKVEAEKIIKAVHKLDGIDIVLENPQEAKEAIYLILRKVDILGQNDRSTLKDLVVTSYQEYRTSAVDYKMVFLLDFQFEDQITPDFRVSLLKRFQDFFNKV